MAESSDIENAKEHFADEGSEEEEQVTTSRKHYSDDEEDEEEEEEDEGPVSTKSTIAIPTLFLFCLLVILTSI
jgi:hypothetical protein